MYLALPSPVRQTIVLAASALLLVACMALAPQDASATSFESTAPAGVEPQTTSRYASPDDALRQGRTVLRSTNSGAILDRLAGDRNVAVISDSRGRCGTGAVGCTFAAYATVVVWLDWDKIRARSPQRIASILAHEFTHAIEWREYNQVYAYFAGEAGIWQETRALMIEGRVLHELGLRHPLVEREDGTWNSPGHVATLVRFSYATLYGVPLIQYPSLVIPMTVGNQNIARLATRIP